MPTHSPANLTTSDLQKIYTCAIVQWSQITDIAGYTGPATTIHAYLTGVGSDTRSNFLRALGITATSEPCWEARALSEGDFGDSAYDDPDTICPMTLAQLIQWLLHHPGCACPPPRYDASVDGISEINTATLQINQAFATTSYGELEYHVVRQADWADSVEGPRLKALLDTSAHGGWLCRNASAGAAQASLLTNEGLLPLASGACGVGTTGT